MKHRRAVHLVQKVNRHERNVAALLAAGVALSFAAIVVSGTSLWNYKKRHSKPGVHVARVKKLSAKSASFFNIGFNFSRPECERIEVERSGNIGILHLNCSPEAYRKDGEGVRLSENFTVHEGIARRFNFWRRVYSVWTKDQYVMHVSEYPEVVLEAYDISAYGESLGPIAKDKLVKKFSNVRRESLKATLMNMHKLRKTPAAFTERMHQIAQSMAHISDANKYNIAAHALRIQRGQTDFIKSGLEVSGKYLPAIELEFRSQGIPQEITRLAFVESSFNLKAQSKVGASGVYQIMPNTGKQYLRMEPGIDERNDPIKASRAAAKLLRLNYKLTGNWPLAITAYNHGVGGIRRAVKSVGNNNIVQLINRYDGPQFGFASKNFYASFLAVYATVSQADKIFPDVKPAQPLNFATLKLSKETAVKDIKHRFVVNASDLLELNPDLSSRLIRSHGTLPRGYVIKLPITAQGPGLVYTVATNQKR